MFSHPQDPITIVGMRLEVNARRCVDTVHHIVLSELWQESQRKTCLPRHTSPLQHKCLLLPSTNHPRHLYSFWNKSIFQSSSDLPHLSQVRVIFYELWSNIIWRMLALVAFSPLCCLFWGFLEFLWNEHHSWAPPCWHPSSSRTVFPVTHTGRGPNTAPPVLENKKEFKLKYDSKPTFTCCWLNPAFSTDFLGQSVIYSLHLITKKLKEWKKGHYFTFSFFIIWHDALFSLVRKCPHLAAHGWINVCPSNIDSLQFKGDF